jgi:hypothetical protein
MISVSEFRLAEQDYPMIHSLSAMMFIDRDSR